MMVWLSWFNDKVWWLLWWLHPNTSDKSMGGAFSNLLEDEIAQEDFYMNVGGGEVVITTNYRPILTSNSNHWLHWKISDLSYHQQSEHPSSFPSTSPIKERSPFCLQALSMIRNYSTLHYQRLSISTMIKLNWWISKERIGLQAVIISSQPFHPTQSAELLLCVHINQRSTRG